MPETYELNRFCPDSDCAGIAEPEEELAEGGLLRYWVCRTCETEFSHELTKDEAAEGSCSMGVPEGVRRLLSSQLTGAKADAAGGAPVFLGSSIGRRPQ